MFILLQFTLFDYRLYKDPANLITPVKAWPLVQPGKDFINYFGQVEASFDREIAPVLFPEENIYIACKKAFKFVDLQAGSPCRIEVKLRRLYLDANGGVKLQFGFALHIHRHLPFRTLEEAVGLILHRKVQIKSPHGQPKQMDLVHLGASFKNLYNRATGIDGGHTWVQSQQPLITIDLTEKTLAELTGGEGYELAKDRLMYAKSFRLNQRSFPLFYYGGSTEPLFFRRNRYYLSRIHTQLTSLGGMLYYLRTDPGFPQPAFNALSQLKAILSEGDIPVHIRPIFRMYQQVFPQAIQAYRTEADTMARLAQQKPELALREQISQAIIQADLDAAMRLTEQLAKVVGPEERVLLYTLQARYHLWLRDYQTEVEAQAQLHPERNRILSQLLSYCEGL